MQRLSSTGTARLHRLRELESPSQPLPAIHQHRPPLGHASQQRLVDPQIDHPRVSDQIVVAATQRFMLGIVQAIRIGKMHQVHAAQDAFDAFGGLFALGVGFLFSLGRFFGGDLLRFATTPLRSHP